jgi:hypothetical protein
VQITSMMVYTHSEVLIAYEKYSSSSLAWVVLNGHCQAYGRNVVIDVIH